MGVLGTDPYDKLLVMQALHPALPEAIFFTTDLDALYLHPTEVKRGTKNLVVASAFGLALNDRWQGSIMPFRDSYQTGAFLSTRVALGEKQDRDMLARSLQAPRIYEIGSNSIVDLSPAASAEDCEGALCETIHPARPVPQYRVRAVSAVVFAVRGAAWCSSHSDFARCSTASPCSAGSSARDRSVSVIGLVSLTVFLGFCFRALQDATGEPWAIANGVSMWPTQILRLIALAATWLLLYKGWHDLVRSNEKLGREFLLDGGPAAERPALQESTLARAAHRARSLGDDHQGPLSPVGAGERVRQARTHRRRGDLARLRRPCRVRRAALAAGDPHRAVPRVHGGALRRPRRSRRGLIAAPSFSFSTT